MAGEQVRNLPSLFFNQPQSPPSPRQRMKLPHFSKPAHFPPAPSRLSVRAALVLLTLAAVAVAGLIYQRTRVLATSSRARAQAEARAAATALELQMAAPLGAAKTLAALVRQGGGQLADFQSLAVGLQTAQITFAALEILPAGVVADVAPRAGREHLIGRNVFNDPARRAGALAAYQTRRPTVAGPLRLAGGEPGVMIQVPVFVPGRDGRDAFWGLVAAEARLGNLLSLARLSELVGQGYDYALFAPAQAGQPAATLAAGGQPLRGDYVQQVVHLPNLELRLALRPRAGWHPASDLWLSVLAGLTGLGLLGAALWSWSQQQDAVAGTTRAEEQLGRSRERFRALLEAAPEAMLITDRAGRIQSLNVAAERLFGYRREELLAQPVELVVPSRSRPAHLVQRERYQRTPEARVMGLGLELAAMRKGGAEFPVEVSLCPLPDVSAPESLVCSVIRDLTERQRVQALHRHAQEAHHQQQAEWDQYRTESQREHEELEELRTQVEALEENLAAVTRLPVTEGSGGAKAESGKQKAESNELPTSAVEIEAAVATLALVPPEISVVEPPVGADALPLPSEEKVSSPEPEPVPEPKAPASPELSAPAVETNEAVATSAVVLPEISAVEPPAGANALPLPSEGEVLSPEPAPAPELEAPVAPELPAPKDPQPEPIPDEAAATAERTPTEFEPLPAPLAEAALAPAPEPALETKPARPMRRKRARRDDVAIPSGAVPAVPEASSAVPNLPAQTTPPTPVQTEASFTAATTVAADSAPGSGEMVLAPVPEPDVEPPASVTLDSSTPPATEQSEINAAEAAIAEAASTPAAPEPTVPTTAASKPTHPARRKKARQDDQMSLFVPPPEVPSGSVAEPGPVAETAPAAPIPAPPVEADVLAPSPAARSRADEDRPPWEEPEPVTPATTVPPRATEPDLPAIDGLDLAEGLRQADGHREHYRKLLRQFMAEYAGTAEELRDRLVQGQSAAAGQLAGVLKNAAGQLGAGTVAAAAAAVEHAIAQPADPTEIEWLWADLEQALTPLLRELKRALETVESGPATEAPPVASRSELRKAVHEILPLLAEADPGAAECLAANHEVLRALFAAEAFPQFKELVAAGSYAEALELLRKAAKKHGV